MRMGATRYMVITITAKFTKSFHYGSALIQICTSFKFKFLTIPLRYAAYFFQLIS